MVATAVYGGFRIPVMPDRASAERMERARHEDVIADENDPLFDDTKLELGVWSPSAFLRDYGTALFLTAPYDVKRIPVFLIHGMYGSPRNFAALVTQFRASRYQPVVFFYPTGMSLTDASRELGDRLQEFLGRHPTDGFAVVAHSMGGLVVKGMLDRFDVPRVFPAWKTFVGISCPWGGVAAAVRAGSLPVHPPSWDDLNPKSGFLRRANGTPFPDGLGFYIFFGARGRGALASTLGTTDGLLTVDSMIDTPLTRQAQDTVGFYEDHASILRSRRVFERLEMVMDEAG